MTEITRKTIGAVVGIEGVGLHTGHYTCVELHPAPAGNGIVFVRSDLNHLRIPAVQASTTALDHATSLGIDDVSIGTVEHLLAALVATGLTDIDIHIDGSEIPIIDGSALPFLHLIDAAGIRDLGEVIEPIRITRPIEASENGKTIRITPARKLSIHYRIAFNHPLIGRQSTHFDVSADAFRKKIAPARTFGFLRDVEKLRAAGLARGGTVDNCIVLDDKQVMSGSLRFRDEFVRHKVLDLLGDLALLGRPLIGEITADRAGHALHSQFVGKILESRHCWTADESFEADLAGQAPQLSY